MLTAVVSHHDALPLVGFGTERDMGAQLSRHLKFTSCRCQRRGGGQGRPRWRSGRTREDRRTEAPRLPLLAARAAVAPLCALPYMRWSPTTHRADPGDRHRHRVWTGCGGREVAQRPVSTGVAGMVTARLATHPMTLDARSYWIEEFDQGDVLLPNI